ncbi:IS66 family insertion sequence element accessory protein TnpA, partial [Massilia scottii]
EACRREGTAASVYARQHGLTLASLYYWRRKLKLAAAVGDGGNGAANKFVALRVVDATAVAATSQCTLVLRSGLRLELAALPSTAWLLALEQAHAGAR